MGADERSRVALGGSCLWVVDVDEKMRAVAGTASVFSF